MLTLTAAGSVSDYKDISSLQQNVAIAAGVDASLVAIEVSAASVIITATIAVPASTTATAVQASLSSTLGIAADPSTTPSTALGVTILTVPTITIAGSASGDALGGAPSTPRWPPPPRRPRMLPLPPPPTLPLPSRPLFAPAAAKSTLPAALDDPSADVVTSEVIIGATAGGICAIVALCGTACFCFMRLRGVSHQRLRLFTVGSSAPAAVLPRPLSGVPSGVSVRSKRKSTPPLRALTAHDSQHGDDREKPAAHDGIPTWPSDLRDCTPAQIPVSSSQPHVIPATLGWDYEDDGEWEPPHVLEVEIRNDFVGDGYHIYTI